MNQTVSSRDRYNQERRDSAENRKNQVLDRAQELFLEKGLAKVTMNDIIDRTGLSKATLYRYFKNITEIIFEIQYRMMDELFYHKFNNSSPLSFVMGIIDDFPEHQDAYRYIGMFDHLYSESYPNEELGEQYEKFVSRRDWNEGFNQNNLSDELVTHLMVVINIVISFLQRLALRGKVLEKYQGISVERQLEEFKSMIKREFAF